MSAERAPDLARFVSAGFFSTQIRRIAWLAGVDLRPGLSSFGDTSPPGDWTAHQRTARWPCQKNGEVQYFGLKMRS